MGHWSNCFNDLLTHDSNNGTRMAHGQNISFGTQEKDVRVLCPFSNSVFEIPLSPWLKFDNDIKQSMVAIMAIASKQ